MPSNCRRFVVVALNLALFAASSIRGAAAEKWMRVEAPDFTLCVQTSSERDARDWAVDFEQFRRSMQQVMRIAPTRLKPAYIIVFKDESSYRPFKPRSARSDEDGTSALFKDGATTTILTTFDEQDDNATRRNLYAGGAWWYLSGLGVRNPPWFRRGFGELFETFRVTGSEFQIGKASEGTVHALQSLHLLPLNEIFAVDESTLDFHYDNERTRQYLAETWFFVHYCVFGRDAANPNGHGAQLERFLADLREGRSSADACQNAFGTDLATLRVRLVEYLNVGRYTTLKSKFDRASVGTGLIAVAMTEAEIAVAKGEAELGTAEYPTAQSYFERAIELEPKLAAAYVGLGDLAAAQNDSALAVAKFTRAVELGSRDHRAWWFLAESFITSRLTGVTGLPVFTPEQARETATRLEKSINLNNFFVPAYERLAIMIPSLKTVTSGDRQFLELGLKVAPHSQMIAVGLGAWLVKHGDEAAGCERLQACLNSAAPRDKMAMAMAQSLLARVKERK